MALFFTNGIILCIQKLNIIFAFNLQIPYKSKTPYPPMRMFSFYKIFKSEDKNMKKAFITGITGQDGSYLAEFLLQKNYEVHGLVRRSSTQNISRIKHLINNSQIFILHEGDLTDFINMHRIIEH